MLDAFSLSLVVISRRPDDFAWNVLGGPRREGLARVGEPGRGLPGLVCVSRSTPQCSELKYNDSRWNVLREVSKRSSLEFRRHVIEQRS
jgi:hypothetical protein